jgi:phospholipid/cholesterol/gamma-HCH transport system substrate-binding protein
LEDRAHAIAAGLFTLLLTVCALAAVWWFSGKRGDTRELQLVSERTVSGLASQAQVRFRGIRSGKVDRITIDSKDPRLILVNVIVEEWLPITTATTAEIKMQGVTGLAFVELSDNGRDGQPLPEREGEVPRIPLRPSTFDTAGDQLAATLEQVKELAKRANAVLSPDNIESLGNTLSNLETASAEAGKALRQLPETIAAVRRFASPENAERVARLVAHLESAGRETGPLLKETRDLVASMQAVSRRLDELGAEVGGRMSGEALPGLNVLLHDLSANSRQLSRLLVQLEQSPQELLVRRSAAIPGPGEAGFVPSIP